MAGYVEVEDEAFISGGVVVHQYSKIGRLAMIGGNTRVNSDVPPFFLYSGFNVAAMGLNVVGLKRAGYKHADLAALKKAYQILYRSGLKLADALARIESRNSRHRRRCIWWHSCGAASAASAANNSFHDLSNIAAISAGDSI